MTFENILLHFLTFMLYFYHVRQANFFHLQRPKAVTISSKADNFPNPHLSFFHELYAVELQVAQVVC